MESIAIPGSFLGLWVHIYILPLKKQISKRPFADAPVYTIYPISTEYCLWTGALVAVLVWHYNIQSSQMILLCDRSSEFLLYGPLPYLYSKVGPSV